MATRRRSNVRELRRTGVLRKVHRFCAGGWAQKTPGDCLGPPKTAVEAYSRTRLEPGSNPVRQTLKTGAGELACHRLARPPRSPQGCEYEQPSVCQNEFAILATVAATRSSHIDASSLQCRNKWRDTTIDLDLFPHGSSRATQVSRDLHANRYCIAPVTHRRSQDGCLLD